MIQHALVDSISKGFPQENICGELSVSRAGHRMNITYAEVNQLDLLSGRQNNVLSLTSHSAHVWSFELSAYQDQMSYFATLLDVSETERAQRFLQQHHRERFILAHGLVRLVLSQYLSTLPDDIHFSVGPHKKPYVAEGNSTPHYMFNYSHSETKLLLAVTLKQEIGIDIEQHRPLSQFEDLVNDKFSPAEQVALSQLKPAQQLSAFFSLWARKEALTKAIGLGLLLPFEQISTFFQEKCSGPITIVYPSVSSKTWTIYDLPEIEGYASALAVAGAIEHICYFN